MKAVILAGGFGTRLQSVVGDLPKPMAPVGGKPFLEYLIKQLLHWGIREIVLATCHKAEVIEEYFGGGERWGVNIIHSREPYPLGTAGAIRFALPLVGGGAFLLMNGDSFLGMDIGDFVDYHAGLGKLVTMGLAKSDDVSRYGKVELSPEGLVTSFREKGERGPGLINGGLYVVDGRVPMMIPEGKISLENEVLPGLIGRGLGGYVTPGFFIDIGVPEDYRRICERPDFLAIRG